MISTKRIVSVITIISLAVTMCFMPIMVGEAYAAASADKANNKVTASKYTIKPKQSVKFTFTGANMDITSPIVGDTRYQADKYMVCDARGYFVREGSVNASGAVTLTFKNPGKYEIIGYFYKQQYYYDSDANSIGWKYVNSNGGIGYDINGSLTVTPVLKSTFIKVTGKKYRVTFNANKGKIGKKKTEKKTVRGGNKYGKLPRAKRTGYMFKGWYTKKKGGKKITASKISTQNKKHTLYAHWFGPKGKGKTITYGEYKKIKQGMTYSDVKFLIGGKGKLSSSYSYDGTTRKIYSWYGTNYNSTGANAAISFKNNRVTAKTQIGL